MSENRGEQQNKSPQKETQLNRLFKRFLKRSGAPKETKQTSPDNTKKEQQIKPVRIIELGQEFMPFDPDAGSNGDHIKLKIDNMEIALSIHKPKISGLLYHALTPFDPELGYQITTEDLTLESRMKKLQEIEEKLPEDYVKKINEKAPLGLRIANTIYGFDSRTDLDSDQILALKKINLQIRVGGMRLEGKNQKDAGFFEYNSFYPFDTGPLPTDPTQNRYSNRITRAMTSEGLPLLLPEDPKKLEQIRMKFALAPEEPEQMQKRGGEN